MGRRRLTISEYKAERGITGITQWTIRPDEFRRELQGRAGRLLRQEMSASPPGAAVRRVIEMAYRRVNWHVDAGGKRSVDDKAARFLESCIDDLNVPWKTVVNQIVVNTLEQGWFLAELVMKQRLGGKGRPRSKYDDRRIGWRKWGPRPAITLDDWIIGEDGDWDGIRQVAIMSERIPEPIYKEKALLFRLDDRYGSPEGAGGVFDDVYRAYYFWRELTTIEAIIAERMGGVLIITLPETASMSQTDANSDWSIARNIVENFRADEQMGVVAPAGYQVNLVSPGDGARDLDRIIRRHQSDFFLGALAQWALLGTRNVGSWSLSRDQTDFFLMALEGWLDNIRVVVDDIGVPRLFELNYFPRLEALPQLNHSPLGRENVELLAKAAQGLVSAGLLHPSEEDETRFRELLNLPIPDKATGAGLGMATETAATADENLRALWGLPETMGRAGSSTQKADTQKADTQKADSPDEHLLIELAEVDRVFGMGWRGGLA